MCTQVRQQLHELDFDDFADLEATTKCGKTVVDQLRDVLQKAISQQSLDLSTASTVKGVRDDSEVGFLKNADIEGKPLVKAADDKLYTKVLCQPASLPSHD